ITLAWISARDARERKRQRRDTALELALSLESYARTCRTMRSVGRSAKAAAAGTHLAQSQAPGTHCHLTTAVAPANPQTIASVPIGRQLAEHLTAPQRR
ncbi:hypothetical protein PQQ80_32950, partial [Paraburkholderia sediminicola]